jgi:hypothetical protein
VVNQNGVCIQDTTCPPGQYFSLGSCYNAISNCDTFQPIAGECLTCNSGYTLNNYYNGSQACTQNSQVCQSNQYLLGTTCMNYVNSCANFQTSTGQCQNCQQGYTLSQNQCIQIVTKSSNCQLGYQSLNGGSCVPIDQNCIFYNPNNTCFMCASGYLLQGTCQKLICGPRQYSSTGSCIDVSPFCDKFDPIYGNCLTCIQFYYLQSGGSSLQSLPSQLGVSTNSACPSNYYMRQGTCV